MSSLIISSLITNTIHFYHILQNNSELVEDDTIRSDEVESGDDGLERSESPQIIHELSGESSGVYAGVLWHDADICRDDVLSSLEVESYDFLMIDDISSCLSHVLFYSSHTSQELVQVKVGDDGQEVDSIISLQDTVNVSTLLIVFSSYLELFLTPLLLD